MQQALIDPMRKTTAPRSISLQTQTGRALPWIFAALAVAASAWWYLAPRTLPAALRGLLPASPNAVAEVYKWRDAKGRLQITSTPPTDRPYETLHYDPKLNVVPSVVQPPPQ